MADLYSQLHGILERKTETLVKLFTEDIREAYAEMVPRSPGPNAHFIAREPRHPEGVLAEALLTPRNPDAEFGVSLSIDDELAPHWKWIDQPIGSIEPHGNNLMVWFDTHHGLQARKIVEASSAHVGWWSDTFRHVTVPEVVAQLGRERA